MKMHSKRVARLGAALVVAAGVLVTSSAIADDPFTLLTGFSSKETCSCAFVVEQTDDYCNAFGQQAGYTVTITIDHGAKTVTSSIAGVSRVARFQDGAGCTLDPP